MNEMKVSRQDEASAGVSPAPQQVALRRTLKIENLGDLGYGEFFPGIRLKGLWLMNAGFYPGQRTAVTVVSPGVIELRRIEEREQQQSDSPFDFGLSNHNSVSLFHPLSERASGWLENHCPAGDDHQYFGYALAVEARFVPDLLQRVVEDGLRVAR
jgi:hypothetical protein